MSMSALAGRASRVEPTGMTEPSKPLRPPEIERGRHAHAQLVCESVALVPGTRSYLGVWFLVEPEWHLYWNGRNDSGFPIEITWEAPEGVTIGELQWPAPRRLELAGDIIDHVYEHHVLLMAPIDIDPDVVKPGSNVTITGLANYLVCHEECVPEKQALKLEIAVKAQPASTRTPGTTPPSAATPSEGNGRTPPSIDSALIDPAHREKFREARARLPLAWPEKGPMSIRWTPEHDVFITWPGATALTFFPDRTCVDVVDMQKTTTKGERLTFQTAPEFHMMSLLTGVLEVRAAAGSLAYYRVRWARPIPASGVKPPKN